jgi:hypothetical protein
MRRGIGLLGGLLLAVLCWAEPAAAQGLPQGSYLQSCTRVRLQGDNLIAVCRRADGGEQRTSLAGVYRCVGDIGNMNGTLTCNYGGGAAPPPPLTARRELTARRGASAAANSIARPNACAPDLTGSGTRSTAAASKDACGKSTTSRSVPAAAELPIGC